MVFFFNQKTEYDMRISDWSSDVCSSDLRERPLLGMKDMGMDMSGMGDMPGHSMKMRDPSVAPQVKMGPGVATLSPMPVDRTADRPTGLESVEHRVDRKSAV